MKQNLSISCEKLENSRDASRELYIFWTFLGNVQLASIINKGSVQQILGRENIFDPPILDQLQKDPS